MWRGLNWQTVRGQAPWRTMAFHKEAAYTRREWGTRHHHFHNISMESAKRYQAPLRIQCKPGKIPLSCPIFHALLYWFLHPLCNCRPALQAILRRSTPLSSRRVPYVFSRKTRTWIVRLKKPADNWNVCTKGLFLKWTHNTQPCHNKRCRPYAMNIYSPP